MTKFWTTRVVSILFAIGMCFVANALLVNLPNEYPYRLALLSGLYVSLAVSLNLINGITGQFSVGHAAFYMVGAYTTGIFAKMFMPGFVAAIPFGTVELKQGLWLICMMILGALVAALAGLVVGMPSLRLRGDYLAIVTLGFGEILRIIGQNINFKSGTYEIVAGAYGIQGVPKLYDLWLVLILACLSISLCRNLLKTAHGLPFLAVREDEVASSAMGVDVTRVKVTAFVIGAAIAGAAGSLLMHYETYVSPASFRMEVSFLVLTMVVLGGTGSITGSTVGAIVLFLIPEGLRLMQDGAGDPIHITAGVFTGAIVSIIAATFLAKRLKTSFHGTASNKILINFGLVLGAVLGSVIIGLILNLLPFMSAKTWTFTDLRWSILAFTLIIIMMLRPQGIFAHHELSLDKFFDRLPKGLTS